MKSYMALLFAFAISLFTVMECGAQSLGGDEGTYINAQNAQSILAQLIATQGGMDLVAVNQFLSSNCNNCVVAKNKHAIGVASLMTKLKSMGENPLVAQQATIPGTVNAKTIFNALLAILQVGFGNVQMGSPPVPIPVIIE